MTCQETDRSELIATERGCLLRSKVPVELRLAKMRVVSWPGSVPMAAKLIKGNEEERLTVLMVAVALASIVGIVLSPRCTFAPRHWITCHEAWAAQSPALPRLRVMMDALVKLALKYPATLSVAASSAHRPYTMINEEERLTAEMDTVAVPLLAAKAP